MRKISLVFTALCAFVCTTSVYAHVCVKKSEAGRCSQAVPDDLDRYYSPYGFELDDEYPLGDSED